MYRIAARPRIFGDFLRSVRGTSIQSLYFINGACKNETPLRHHAPAPIKEAQQQLSWSDVTYENALGAQATDTGRPIAPKPTFAARTSAIVPTVWTT
jgi:hypothetical protein